MPTDVLMPQMGESIAEGTIVRWLKRVGEAVDRDEPLFEISTDKVDAEVPAPAGGVLVRIRAEAGETVPVNSIVAVIGAAGEAVSASAVEPPPASAGAPPAPADLEASQAFEIVRDGLERELLIGAASKILSPGGQRHGQRAEEGRYSYRHGQ